MKDNTELWNKFKSVPKEAQKAIGGGRLKGMTDISPMWRYLELTKQFGPCGVGWKYTIDKEWSEEGANGEKCAFANISMFIKYDGAWSDAIPGTGGSMLVAKEKAGPHTSDECYKMAVTDALSVACKVLGIGADIYWFAGSKYSNQSDTPTPTPAPKVTPQGTSGTQKLSFKIEVDLKSCKSIDELKKVYSALSKPDKKLFATLKDDMKIQIVKESMEAQ